MKKGIRREFGYVRQLKSGKFQASFKMGKKTIYAPSSFLTRTEAKNWLSEQKYLVTVGQFKFPAKPKSNELSFYEFAFTYLSLKTNSKAMPLSPSYVAKCKQHLNGSLKVFASRPLSSRCDLQQISPDVVTRVKALGGNGNDYLQVRNKDAF